MKIAEIEKLTTTYKRLSKTGIDYKKYAYYALTHHSTSIEGSTLSESQVINLLEYGKPAPNKPFEHHQMVFDHFRALMWVVEVARQKTPFSPSFVQQIAAKVMKNTGSVINTVLGNFDVAQGEFRLCSVRAGSRTFPDYKKVPTLIGNLCDDTNRAFSQKLTFQQKIELSFKVHFDFVSIHPFGDGNGRTSRLLMNYIQAYFDLPLGVVFKQDRLAYINALETTRSRDDLTPFYDFMYSQYTKFLKQEIKEMEK